ncbi:UNVERIFIED_CONTAM: hypothetical protein Slati_0438400 [Sesamum latifolium]|uniref:Uncharacterized protein n=1 Tax=Sesamum latifolium TaxID=2727402 RepID=A0AAW2XVG8_9LAMI
MEDIVTCVSKCESNKEECGAMTKMLEMVDWVNFQNGDWEKIDKPFYKVK